MNRVHHFHTEPSLNRRQLLLGTAGAALLPVSTSSLANASTNPATWPAGPLRIIVGFTAGSSPDLMARLLAEPLSKALGKPVIVENKPGAGGNLSADAVAKSEDGLTVGLLGNGPLTASPHLYSKLPYKPSDFKAVTLVGTSPLALVCQTKHKFANAQEFWALAKAGGSKWNYGSVGIGSGTHLVMELLRAKVDGLDPVHIPFQGGPQVLTAMIGGQIDVAVLPLGTAMPQIRSGRVTGVGITTSGRSTLAPELPSMTDLGIADFSGEVWNGIFLPASMPEAVAEKLATALSPIIRSQEIREKLFAQGWKAEGTAPDALRTRMRVDSLVYGGIIKKRAIKLEG
jgi:tripartite-type tricarboxylate transporter receptor subunit TctC